MHRAGGSGARDARRSSRARRNNQPASWQKHAPGYVHPASRPSSYHSEESGARTWQVEVTHAVAMFFVGEARKNGRQPANQEEVDNMMIYNYPPTYTGRHRFPGEETDFEQSYIFGREAEARST